jgi:short-subunit dehydrogenase
MRAWQLDANDIDRLLAINLRAPMAAAARLIPQLLKQGSGALAFVSSVAGYRGLPKAAAYGPTKAALINFAETLYLDLAPRGLSVYLINPGFVATPMTAANDFEMPALISPQQAAEEIIAGFGRGSFEIHFPRRFTYWLKLLRLLPYSLYFALVKRFTRL